jgi:hypothetical protein
MAGGAHWVVQEGPHGGAPAYGGYHLRPQRPCGEAGTNRCTESTLLEATERCRPLGCKSAAMLGHPKQERSWLVMKRRVP